MKHRNHLIAFGVIGVFVVVSACEKLVPQAPESNEILAEPIGTLTDGQLSLHLKGDELFAHVFSKEEGLGPIFVNAACENCHAGDGKGSVFNLVTRFGKYSDSDPNVWDEMPYAGGPQLQQRAISDYAPEEVPDGAKTMQLLPMNLTGLGYLSAIEDQYLLDLVAEQAAGGIVSGEVNYVDPTDYFVPQYFHIPNNGKYIGRFGRKASTIDLLHRAVDAFKEDMGITSDYDTQDLINYSVSNANSDDVGDPEVPASTVDAVVFYLKTLESPRRRDEDDPDVIEGENIFKNIGCNHCHRETMKTGRSEVEALNEVEFTPYTDMLLHDLGSEWDFGYTEGTAKTSEWRTPPLWGLGLQNESQGGQVFLMHDGSATSYDEAIMLHGGEAAVRRQLYTQLSDESKEKLFKFLNSL